MILSLALAVWAGFLWAALPAAMIPIPIFFALAALVAAAIAWVYR